MRGPIIVCMCGGIGLLLKGGVIPIVFNRFTNSFVNQGYWSCVIDIIIRGTEGWFQKMGQEGVLGKVCLCVCMCVCMCVCGCELILNGVKKKGKKSIEKASNGNIDRR